MVNELKEKTVETKYGLLAGTTERHALVWRGIPYAKAPVGDLRFRHAQPPEPWTGVRQAKQYGKCSVQAGGKQTDEDSLTLNIWSPDIDKKHAVMLHIHGGSFMKGTGSDPRLNGARLAKTGDVVVVTMNYRLGALGFMDFSSIDEAFQPNCGLSDMVQALRWLRENVAAFGGDPENITVIGQSAGAIAVSALTVMPMAQPYISRAIMMSGGPVWMHRPQDAQAIAQAYMNLLGVDDARKLRGIPASELVAKQKQFIKFGKHGDGTFAPVIDRTMLPEYPIPAARQGAGGGIPMLIGTTKDELAFCSHKLWSKVLLVKDVALALLSVEKKEIRQKIVSAYQKYGIKAESMFYTDQIFRMSSTWMAQEHSRYAPTWMYSFDYEPLAMKLTGLHACHGSDIPFLFGNFFAGSAVFVSALSPIRVFINRVSLEMQHDFSSFAKTGRLPWERCAGKTTPAKCYNAHFTVRPMVDPDIVEHYEQTEFHKNCFQAQG